MNDKQIENKADDIVDDIVRRESDEALKKEDEKVAQAFKPAKGFKAKLKEIWHRWWDNKKLRYSTLGGFAALLIILFAVPLTRYGILNAVGVRASAHVVVVDQDTQLPLKNVSVSLGGQTAETNIDGVADLNSVRLGSGTLEIKKIAYADLTQNVTVKLTDNSFESMALEPIGTQFAFSVKDWLSKLPIESAEAVYGESSALSNEEGAILLNIEPTSEEMITITLTGEGYMETPVDINTTNQETSEVELVTDEPHYFISNRNGSYGIYRVNLDGSNEKLVIEGTGKERDDTRFSVNHTANHGALVSTRDGNRNHEGYLLSGLFILNLDTGQMEAIDESERIDIVGWVDDYVIYVKVAAGASGNNPLRHRLISYNVATGTQTQLAASNYFNDVVVAQDKIFYAPSDYYKQNPKPYLFKVDAAKTEKKVVHAKEVWSLIRKNYDRLVFDAQRDWYTYTISLEDKVKIDGAPNNRNSRLYTDSPDNSKSLWSEQRDGKGTLLLYDTETRKDNVLHRQSGLRDPLRWLSDKHIVYRVVTDTETADYVLNIEGGEPQKITDVADSGGADRWYYYY